MFLRVLSSGYSLIRNLKGFYRSKLNSRLILALDANPDKHIKDMFKTISLLDALHLLSESWDDVKSETIANCFRHGGFKVIPTEDSNTDFNSLEDVPVPSNMTDDTFREMVVQDAQTQTSSELTDEEIIETASMVQLSKKSRTEECFSSDSEDEDEPDISDQEVLKSLFMARKYAQKKGLSKEVFFSLSKMEQSVSQDMMEKKKQSNITEYFKK